MDAVWFLESAARKLHRVAGSAPHADSGRNEKRLPDLQLLRRPLRTPLDQVATGIVRYDTKRRRAMGSPPLRLSRDASAKNEAAAEPLARLQGLDRAGPLGDVAYEAVEGEAARRADRRHGELGRERLAALAERRDLDPAV